MPYRKDDWRRPSKDYQYSYAEDEVEGRGSQERSSVERQGRASVERQEERGGRGSVERQRKSVERREWGGIGDRPDELERVRPGAVRQREVEERPRYVEERQEQVLERPREERPRYEDERTRKPDVRQRDERQTEERPPLERDERPRQVEERRRPADERPIRPRKSEERSEERRDKAANKEPEHSWDRRCSISRGRVEEQPMRVGRGGDFAGSSYY